LILGGGVNTWSPSVLLALRRSQQPANDNGETKEEVFDTNEGEKTWTMTYWAENKSKKKDKK
jgi:hypothetical protein